MAMIMFRSKSIIEGRDKTYCSCNNSNNRPPVGWFNPHLRRKISPNERFILFNGNIYWFIVSGPPMGIPLTLKVIFCKKTEWWYKGKKQPKVDFCLPEPIGRYDFPNEIRAFVLVMERPNLSTCQSGWRDVAVWSWATAISTRGHHFVGSNLISGSINGGRSPPPWV